MRRISTSSSLVALAALALFTACDREHRIFQPVGGTAASPAPVVMNPNQAGVPTPQRGFAAPYDSNSAALSDGQRLFDWYNCSGCHAHGGGGMGPPLMDDKWIYGSQPQNVFATIVEGRPNGMPSYRGKIPDDQVWRLVSYVRSMSGLTSRYAAPGRPDDMHAKPPEQSMPDPQLTGAGGQPANTEGRP